MRYVMLVPALVLCTAAGSALARVDGRDVATSAGVSASLYSTFKDDKRIIPARDELSAFVASGGAIRGVYVDAALQRTRQSHPGIDASDEALAQALLSQDDLLAEQ